ncbi:glycerophosphodiester phosphodiesterase [Halorubrum sp. AS12]|uniref:glycerophosphodiester phosphodiesterase n=1 Tax=Halorubrum sp. AS12 TaxID=3409687 RepID=UPI003DA70E9E
MSDTDSSGSDVGTEPTRRAMLRRTEPTRRAVIRRTGPIAVGAVAATAGCIDRGGDEASENRVDRDVADPPVIAHRGFAAEYPENTVAAVEAAAAVVDRIELDVRRCGSGELVTFHDATLGRVTDATGRVDRTPYERLADLSVEGSGEPVPTLAEALDAVPADAWVMLDLKSRGVAADAVATGADRGHDLAVTADDPAVLEAVRRADPAVPTVYSVRESVPARLLRPLIPGRSEGTELPRWAYPSQDVAGMVETATELGCAAVSPRYELCLRTDIVSRAADAGLRVLPWTVASARGYEALAAAGVDAVVSDVTRGLRET